MAEGGYPPMPLEIASSKGSWRLWRNRSTGCGGGGVGGAPSAGGGSGGSPPAGGELGGGCGSREGCGLVADNQVFVVSDGDEEEAPRPPAAAAAAHNVSSSRLGTHVQSAADLLAAFPLPPPVRAGPARMACGMPQALRPLRVSHTPPPESANPPPAAADVLLIVDTRDTHDSGHMRSEVFARLSSEPGLTGRVFERKLPVGDALLVARINPYGAASVDGAPPEGTKVVLDFLVERKTAEDLVASIQNARLVEQAYYMAATRRPSLVCVARAT